MRSIAGVFALVAALGCPRQDDPVTSARPAVPSDATAAVNPSKSASARQAERDRLVSQLQRLGIADERVLSALRRVPRHAFVPESVKGRAYVNEALPIGYGQTISQPIVVAAMTESVAPRPTDRCLEIGTGSGYQAAVLAEVCGKVYSIEYLASLAETAEQNLRSAGYDETRVVLRTGDGYGGWPEAAPFDVVLVTAAPESVPRPLLDQLGPGGRLVIPIGPRGATQQLELFTKSAEGRLSRTTLMTVRFVPFVGEAEQHQDRDGDSR
jgi:protein-L-isoaspartate(D-aspartate) O-methyltransferase